MSQKLSFFSPQDTAFGQNRTIFWAKKFPAWAMLQISKPFLSRNRNDQGRPEVPYFSPDLFIDILFIFSTYVRPPPTRPGLRSWSRLFLTTGLGLWLGAVMSRNMAQVQYWNPCLWILVKELSILWESSENSSDPEWKVFRFWRRMSCLFPLTTMTMIEMKNGQMWNKSKVLGCILVFLLTENVRRGQICDIGLALSG